MGGPMDNTRCNLVAIVEKELGDNVTEQWIDRLFDFFSANHDRTWAAKVREFGKGEEAFKAAWFKQLKQFRKSALSRAIKKMEDREVFATYPPSIAQMTWLCKTQPEDLGLPSDEEAFQLFAYRRQRECAPVFHATNRITAFNVRQYSAKEAKRIFVESYRAVVSEIDNGDLTLCTIPEVPELPDRAPELMHKHDDIQGSQAHVGRMFSLLGIKKPTQGVPA